MLTNDSFLNGTIIREPVGPGQGYWAGAPGAFYDPSDRSWYLTYRLRRPRGVQPDRGGEVRIARSGDLERWEDIVTIGKHRYDSASIERSCLHRAPNGEWHYFTSYVNPSDGRWCTAVLKAASVAGLDPARREVIFTGPPLGLEGVKDPWIHEEDGVYYLFLSVATPVPVTTDASHATLDIFNTGECKSATGLAVSRDLRRWEWQGVVLAPGESGWDQYCRRMNSLAALPAEKGASKRYLGFYDGSASHLENYEERCALAVASDLRRWETRSPRSPAFVSPYGSGSVRYVDAKFADGRWHLFYEFARADGAHDLRFLRRTSEELSALLPPQT